MEAPCHPGPASGASGLLPRGMATPSVLVAEWLPSGLELGGDRQQHLAPYTQGTHFTGPELLQSALDTDSTVTCFLSCD